MSATHTLIKKFVLDDINAPLSIIDFGCGDGTLLSYIPADKISSYVGFDTSLDAILQAKKQWKQRKYTFKAISPHGLPSFGATHSIDRIVLVGVWQYLDVDERSHVLSEAQRVLTESGKLIISCTTDHAIYRFASIYRLFLPHHYCNRKSIISVIETNHLQVTQALEKGIALAPIFSNIVVFFMDAFDRLVLGVRGTIGPIGRLARRLIEPLLYLEFLIPLDYGYTLYLVVKKEKKHHLARKNERINERSIAPDTSSNPVPAKL